MSRLRTHSRRRAGRALAGLGVIALVVSFLVPATARPARADVSIDAAGSTWVQIALDQWAADVARQGLSINYQGVGSTSGRVFYYQDQVDFAASEIPFTTAYKDATGTVSTNEVALAAHRPYAYMPDVAGGTSFMYHLDIAGNRVTNLQLSPTNLAKIFTGVITNWNDPALAADNPQLQLPNLPIRPVVRSDGSGTTAQFTAFMASQTPALWNAFCQRVGYNQNPCPSVSLWPDINATQQQFSDGVADYVAAPYNNGAITYVEYGYAKQRGFPVASILNHAGYYTQPTPNAVAIALQGATLNADLTQNLGAVYTFPDPRAYPVSSYSYMIVPTTTASPFTTDKGVTLSKFILYLVCRGPTRGRPARLFTPPEEPGPRRIQRRHQDPGTRQPAPDRPMRQPHHHRRVRHERRAPAPGQRQTRLHAAREPERERIHRRVRWPIGRQPDRGRSRLGVRRAQPHRKRREREGRDRQSGRRRDNGCGRARSVERRVARPGTRRGERADLGPAAPRSAAAVAVYRGRGGGAPRCVRASGAVPATSEATITGGAPAAHGMTTKRRPRRARSDSRHPAR